MTEHYIAYHGLVGCSLGVMHDGYLRSLMTFINDIRVTRGTRTRAPMTLIREEEWIKSLEKSMATNNVFAVLRHADAEGSGGYEYVGHMGIRGMRWPVGVGVTGSLLGNLDMLGKGYGTEAKLLLQYHAFRVLGLRKLTSQVKAFNGQSLGHLLKCGYRIIGRHRDHEFYDGGFVDEILLEVFREDWEPIWKRYQETGELPKLTDEQRALVARETGEKK